MALLSIEPPRYIKLLHFKVTVKNRNVIYKSCAAAHTLHLERRLWSSELRHCSSSIY